MNSFAEWQSHFSIPSQAWDQFQQSWIADASAVDPAPGPNSLEFIIWCIENGHLSESQFTHWLSELSALPVVRNDYFEIPIDFPFWERVREVSAWTAERLPLADWDGVLAVGTLWPPIANDLIRQPTAIVLCPPRGLKFIAEQLGFFKTAENGTGTPDSQAVGLTESASKTESASEPEVVAEPSLQNGDPRAISDTHSAEPQQPAGVGQDFFAQLEKTLDASAESEASPGVDHSSGHFSDDSAAGPSTDLPTDSPEEEFALPDGLALSPDLIHGLQVGRQQTEDLRSELPSALPSALPSERSAALPSERSAAPHSPLDANTTAVLLHAPALPEVQHPTQRQPTSLQAHVPVNPEPATVAIPYDPRPDSGIPTAETPIPLPQPETRNTKPPVTDRFRIPPPPIAPPLVPPPPPIPQPAAAQTKKSGRKFDAPPVTSFFSSITSGGRAAIGGAAADLPRSQDDLVRMKAIPIAQIETRHIDESRSIDEAGAQALVQSSNIFEVSMILLFRDGSLLPWKWSDLFLSVRGDRPDAIDLDEASMFRIVFKTGKPYHGYVVTNIVNQKFFNEFYRGMLPKHATIVPVMVDSRMAGMILGFTNSKVDYRQSLRLMERLSFDLGRVFTRLRSGLAKTG